MKIRVHPRIERNYLIRYLASQSKENPLHRVMKYRSLGLLAMFQLVWVASADVPPFPDTANECQAAEDQPNWSLL